MSRAISTGTGKPYGVQRVCRVLGFPRSTIYAGRARESGNVVPLVAQRRGPKLRCRTLPFWRPSGPILLPRPLPARPSQGMGAAADPARHPRLAHPCAAADAGEHLAVTASSAPGQGCPA
jgi:hypothetical protein